MSDAEVSMKFSGTAADAERAIAQLERKYANLENKIKHLGQSSRRSSMDGAKGFAELAARAVDVASPIAVATAAIRTYNAAIQDKLALEKKSADATVNFAAAFRQVALNAGSVDQAEVSIANVRRGANVSNTTAARALSGATSARGNISMQDTERAVIQGLRMAGPIEDAQAILPTAALALMKVLPEGTTPQQALGLMRVGGELSRVEDISKQGANVAPGIANLIQGYGDSPEFATALIGTLSQGMEDRTGERSRTAALSMAMRLRQRFPDEPNTEARLRRVQADPELQKAVIEGGRIGREKFTPMEMEVESRTTVESILTGGTFGGMLGEYQGRVPAMTEMGGLFEKLVQEMDKAPSQVVAKNQRLAQAGIESQLLAKPGLALQSITRETLDERLQAAGVGYFGRLGNDARMLYASDPIAQAESIVAQNLRGLMGPGAANREELAELAFTATPENLDDGRLTPSRLRGVDDRGETSRQLQALGQLLMELQGMRQDLKSVQRPVDRTVREPVPPRTGGE